MRRGHLLTTLAGMTIMVAIIAALILVGGPQTARLERLDERRMADLDALVHWIRRYQATEGQLPDSLGALEPTLPGSVSALDPVTGAHYGYERLPDGHFRLCTRLAVPDKHAPERYSHARRLGAERVIEAVTDPDGRQLCLETAELPAGDD